MMGSAGGPVQGPAGADCVIGHRGRCPVTRIAGNLRVYRAGDGAILLLRRRRRDSRGRPNRGEGTYRCVAVTK
jgi:hypothetical protein